MRGRVRGYRAAAGALKRPRKNPRSSPFSELVPSLVADDRTRRRRSTRKSSNNLGQKGQALKSWRLADYMHNEASFPTLFPRARARVCVCARTPRLGS